MTRYGDIARVINGLRTSRDSIELHATLYFPCAMALRLMPCSPRRRIRLVTVAAGLMADPSPVGSYRHRQLGTSNGCQDHTVLPYATSAVRPARRESLTGRTRPAITLRADAAASTASHPAFVTIAIRPSCRDGTARAGRTDLPDGESEIFFLIRLDRANRLEPARQIQTAGGQMAGSKIRPPR